PLASRLCRAAGRALGRLLPGRAADAVDCTVFAPPAVPRAVPFLVQVFAHTPEQAERAGTLAREFDESAQRRGFNSLAARVSKGWTLSFHLSLPGAEVGDPVQQLPWGGAGQDRLCPGVYSPFSALLRHFRTAVGAAGPDAWLVETSRPACFLSRGPEVC